MRERMELIDKNDAPRNLFKTKYLDADPFEKNERYDVTSLLEYLVDFFFLLSSRYIILT